MVALPDLQCLRTLATGSVRGSMASDVKSHKVKSAAVPTLISPAFPAIPSPAYAFFVAKMRATLDGVSTTRGIQE